MKSLLLMRHAKSDWADAELGDADRPLNDRGRKDAPRMAIVLNRMAMLPQIIYSSPAKRAFSTAEYFTEKYPKEILKIQRVAAFYPGSPQVYLSAVHEVPEEYKRVMFVGHNPGLEDTLSLFASNGILNSHLATASVAYLEFDAPQWKDIRPGSGCLRWLLTPKTMKNLGF